MIFRFDNLLGISTQQHPLLVPFFLLFFLLIVPIYILTKQRKRQEEKRYLLQHVIITGGSSGIGLSIARHCLQLSKQQRKQSVADKRQGNHVGCLGIVVTLLARNRSKLEKAKQLLEQEFALSDKTNDSNDNEATDKVVILSADVTNYSQLCGLASEHCRTHGPPTMLYNVAGTSAAGTFQDTTVETFKFLWEQNCLGSVLATKAFLPFMTASNETTLVTKNLARRKRKGAIVFTSSAAGQIGIYGYSAYASSKFALRGLAESLAMELQHLPHHLGGASISVTVAYPPDTQTPGYEVEMARNDKPLATQLLSETAGLWDAEKVADAMVQGVLDGKTAVYLGLEGWMLATVTAGMSGVGSVVEGVVQVFLMGVLRLVGLVYLWDFGRVVKKCHSKEKEKEKEKEKKTEGGRELLEGKKKA